MLKKKIPPKKSAKCGQKLFAEKKIGRKKIIQKKLAVPKVKSGCPKFTPNLV